MMKDDGTGVGPFGLRQRSDSPPAAGGASHMVRPEPFVEGNPLRLKGGQESIAGQSEAVAVILKAELIIAGLRLGRAIHKGPDAWDPLQAFDQEAYALGALLVANVQLVQLW